MTLLSRTETAEMLRVSKRTLDRLVRDGQLPAVYVARRPTFLEEDVKTLIRRKRRWL